MFPIIGVIVNFLIFIIELIFLWLALLLFVYFYNKKMTNHFIRPKFIFPYISAMGVNAICVVIIAVIGTPEEKIVPTSQITMLFAGAIAFTYLSLNKKVTHSHGTI